MALQAGNKYHVGVGPCATEGGGTRHMHATSAALIIMH